MDVAEGIDFGTDGWRARLSEFTEPRVRLVGHAVADYLDEEGPPGPVAIGYDARERSEEFADAIAEAIAAHGRTVHRSERDCPTPVLAWTVADGSYAAGCMITASHNPPEYNGIKVLPADGSPAPTTVTAAIEARLGTVEPDARKTAGTQVTIDMIEPYLEHASGLFDADLGGVEVAYDGMHGSGRGVTDTLLERAGADVVRIRCERDPSFGGSAPEPEPERVQELIERVTSGDAELGIVNDGDADRIGVVTPDRGYLDPNRLFAALYAFLLESESGDVVRTVSTSSLVDRVATAHGHSVHETAVGFKWIAAAMAEHNALVGGEESGGFGLRGHLRNKDGVAIALATTTAAAAQSLDDRVASIIATHGEIHQDRVSLNCPDERKERVIEKLADALPSAVAGTAVDSVNDVDGFKIHLTDGGWLLVRPSGTEPKLRLYAEGQSSERVNELLRAGQNLVEPLI
ncbi:MAG: phosphoglucomutase/phosphomannomutase family protein [Salinirussus sp.]